jgi:chromosome segregation ATPase
LVSDKLLSNAAKAFQEVREANKEAVDKLIIEIKLLPKPEGSVVLSPISKVVANDKNNLLKSRTSELNLCEENLSNMLKMKASLEAELEALNKDIASASSRRDSLRAEVSRLVASPTPAPAAAAAASRAVATPEFDSKSISDKLSDFADNLSSVGKSVVTGLLSQGGKSESYFSTSNSAAVSSSSGEDRKALSFQAFESYAESEASCLEALANRIVLLRGRIQLKQRELAEYKKIGVSVRLHL